MWIFFNDAFLSVVAHRDRPDTLMVRARVRGDIERVFPGAKVTRSPAADYLFRAEVRRGVVAAALSIAAAGISYPNFKGSVRDRDRLETYHDVWDVMLSWQHRRQRARKPKASEAALVEPYLDTGDRLLTRSGLDVYIERVQELLEGGDPIVSFRYVRSGKRFTYPERMARRWLRGAVPSPH